MIFLKKSKPTVNNTWFNEKKLTPNGLFDHVLLCNLDRRNDRLNFATEQCERVGIKFERIQAVDGSNENWQKKLSFTITDKQTLFDSGTAALNETLRNVLKRAIDEKWESFLWMEDDVKFAESFSALFEIGVKYIPDNWRIIHSGDCTPWVSHAAIDYNGVRHGVSKIINHIPNMHFTALRKSVFQDYYDGLVKKPEEAIDRIYSINMHDGGYAFFPPIVFQEKKKITSDLSDFNDLS